MLKKIRNNLVYFKNTNPWLYLLWFKQLQRKGRKQIKTLSDVEAINQLYFKKSGRYPNIKDPVLFSEKQQWLKLYDRNSLMPICADKWEVREYLIKKGYNNILSKVIAVFESIDQIDIKKLPERFVLKATHASGWNLICNDKNKINWFIWKKILKNWLSHDIFWNGREWHYKDIKPRLICEEFMEDGSGGLMDYKFYCFNGQPKFVQANNGRGQKVHAQNFYNLNWEIQPFGKDLSPIPEIEIPKPTTLQKMIEIAKDLATPFPYVRVDFYEVNQKIIFGELTFFPASGMPDFIPAEYDRIVGDLLTLPQNNNE